MRAMKLAAPKSLSCSQVVNPAARRIPAMTRAMALSASVRETKKSCAMSLRLPYRAILNPAQWRHLAGRRVGKKVGGRQPSRAVALAQPPLPPLYIPRQRARMTNHGAALGSDRHGDGGAQSGGRAPCRPDDADGAPRRHWPGARGQDRFHHQPDPQSGRRADACRSFPPWPTGASCAPTWSRSPTIALRASPTRSTSPSLRATRRSGRTARAQ